MSNIHTGHHDYNAAGSSPEIEGYIKQSFDYALANLPVIQPSMIDLGADYGYVEHLAGLSQHAGCCRSVELYSTHNPFGLDILRENLEDPMLASKLRNKVGHSDLAFVNHVLEHLYNPHAFMQQVRMLASNVFIAVPHADAPWSRWEGHYSIWTPEWLTHFMSLHGFYPIVQPTTRCFRGDNTEIWGLFSTDLAYRTA